MKKFDDKPDEKYEKFIYDWKDAEHIETLENIGVGGYALIKMVRNGRFWDIESVEQWRSEVPDSPTEVYDNTHQPPTPEPTSVPTPTPAPPTAPDIRDFTMKTTALSYGMSFVKMMVDAPDRFKKLIKVATTPELLEELVYTYADKFSTYLTNDDAVDKENPAADVPDENPEEFSLREDDVPF